MTVFFATFDVILVMGTLLFLIFSMYKIDHHLLMRHL